MPKLMPKMPKLMPQLMPNYLQMSKSTGNFLTLSEAVERFSADGKNICT